MFRLLMMAMLVGWTGAAWADGNPAAGKTVFEGECAPCHSLDKATQLAGPSLIGVVGRKSGALDDYDYSMAMLGADKTWDAGMLDAYLTNPQAIVPGTKMPYPGLASAVARQNLIAYLATVHE